MTNKLKNPIIPGFYPDPSICRVGEDYYIACSSFELYPGVPIFHSRDLAHWDFICNAMTKDNGFHVEKNTMVGGVMAPTLRYNNGIFYIMNTNFSDRGNYIITAEDPKGPWSMPHWLNDVPGIDASLFFDHDGKAYVMGTGEVWDNGAGHKERGIWLAGYDVENFKMTTEPVTIFNSALRVGASPEAPHLYHIGDYYYLIIAEGGTEHHHAVMAARSKDLFGFYEGNPANPVMTHRHMGYQCDITNVGHADLVELPDGSWYAVLLASRLIEGKCKNLGRETFICPVIWERDWPLFSPGSGKIDWEYDAPKCLPWQESVEQQSYFEFGSDKLEDLRWVTYGSPYGQTYEIKDSKLMLKCVPQRLADDLRPMSFEHVMSKEYYCAFLAMRQCSIHTTAMCQMSFLPEGRESAGLAVVQAMNHQLHVVRAQSEGKQVLQVILIQADYDRPPYFPGFESTTKEEILAQAEWQDRDIVLKIKMQGETFQIFYGSGKECLKELCTVDGNQINPEKVGCMAGTLIGMYATGNGTRSDKYAGFDWFLLEE